jgi:hypothetical protein
VLFVVDGVSSVGVAGVDRKLKLDHARIVVILDLADGLVHLKGDPLVLRVGVSEVLDLSLPVADGVLAFHQVNEQVLHLIDVLVQGLDRGLVKALTPAVVPIFVLLGVLRGQLELADLDHDFILLGSGRKADTHANLCDDIVLLLSEEPQLLGGLDHAVINVAHLSLGVVRLGAGDVHQDLSLPGRRELRIVVHESGHAARLVHRGAVEILPKELSFLEGVLRVDVAILAQFLERKEHRADDLME